MNHEKRTQLVCLCDFDMWKIVRLDFQVETSWGTLWKTPLECTKSLCLQFLSVSWDPNTLFSRVLPHMREHRKRVCSWQHPSKSLRLTMFWWFASLDDVLATFETGALHSWGRGIPSLGSNPPSLEIYIDEHNPFEIACSTADLISPPPDWSYVSKLQFPSQKIIVFQHLIKFFCDMLKSHHENITTLIILKASKLWCLLTSQYPQKTL